MRPWEQTWQLCAGKKTEAGQLNSKQRKKTSNNKRAWKHWGARQVRLIRGSKWFKWSSFYLKKTKEKPRGYGKRRNSGWGRRREWEAIQSLGSWPQNKESSLRGSDGDMIPLIRLQSQTEHKRPQGLINFHSQDFTLNARNNTYWRLWSMGKKVDITDINYPGVIWLVRAST